MKKNRYLDCELSLECGKSALLKFVCVSVERRGGSAQRWKEEEEEEYATFFR